MAVLIYNFSSVSSDHQTNMAWAGLFIAVLVVLADKAMDYFVVNRWK